MASKQADVAKPYSVSHSKMQVFRRCLQQYHWKYVDKYFPPSSIGQQRGTSGHAALAVWHVSYNADEASQAAWDSWSNAGYQDGEDWQTLFNALVRYYNWSSQNDTLKLQAAEQKFEIAYEVSGIPFNFTGYIDGIVEEDNRLWILENKFLKRMDNTDSSMDQQASLYMLAAHLLNYDVQGVIYNKVRVADTKVAITEPVVRSRMYRNSLGLDKIQNEMLAQVRSMMLHEKGEKQPYRNPTKDCSWDCAFHTACLSMQDDGQEPTDLLKQIVHIRSTDGE